MEDSELLREFAERGSEQAFTTLVHRYADLVYSTAFRQLRDPHLAQEVAQTVFCLLVRKARSLSKRFQDKKRGQIRAVDNVSFVAKPGQIWSRTAEAPLPSIMGGLVWRLIWAC